MDQADAQFNFVLNQAPNNIPALLGKSQIPSIEHIEIIKDSDCLTIKNWKVFQFWTEERRQWTVNLKSDINLLENQCLLVNLLIHNNTQFHINDFIIFFLCVTSFLFW